MIIGVYKLFFRNLLDYAEKNKVLNYLNVDKNILLL